MQGKNLCPAGRSQKGTSLKAPQRDYCDFCPLGASPYKIYEYHRSLDYEALKESAKRGHCQACAGTVKFLKAKKLKPITLSYHRPYPYQDHPKFPGMEVCFTFASGGSHGYEFFVRNKEHAGKKRTVPSLSLNGTDVPRLRAPSGDTSSTAAFDTLKYWISRCQAEHTQCQPVADKTLPHRVLEIKSIEPLCVRVAENCPRRENYACLSHRWGPQTESNSLKTHDLDLWKVEVPEDRFYPLMRDAIAATFRLGLRFIWVDCYCIFQDDTRDWGKEAANVGRIYENAFLTISATSSEGGCSMFTTLGRELEAFRVAEIGGKAVYIRRRLSHPCGFERVTLQEYLLGPLLTRAWVFQERLLSNRFIHFTSEEIFWECRESTWCECESRSLEWKHQRETKDRTIRGQEWQLIAQQYNNTQLTFEKDRLPALAGAARRYAELLGGWTYLAGLWEEDLVFGLIWQKSAWREPRPLEQVAPTWSWLSLPRGYIEYNDLVVQVPMHPKVRLLGYKIDPPGADVYTGAQSTEITVEGPTLAVRVYKRSIDSLIGRHENAFFDFAPDFNTDPDDPTKYRAVPDGSRCLFLPLMGETEEEPSWHDVLGMVMLQQNSGADGEAAKYERIGLFDTSFSDFCYLDESGDFAEYCGGSFPPFETKTTRASAPDRWLKDRVKTRRVTLV